MKFPKIKEADLYFNAEIHTKEPHHRSSNTPEGRKDCQINSLEWVKEIS